MGLAYSQEPAVQMVGSLADIQPGMKVLDLCAAPGGKSTQLLSRLEIQGLLVSNEISDKRSKILVENIERFGARNVVVTKEDSVHLAKVFAGFFDVIGMMPHVLAKACFVKTQPLRSIGTALILPNVPSFKGRLSTMCFRCWRLTASWFIRLARGHTWS